MMSFEHSIKEHAGLEAQYTLAGLTLQVLTNAQEILNAMQEICKPVYDKSSLPDLSIAFYVDSDRSSESRWPRPHFRALDHLYYATYGPYDSMLIDQHNRRVIGRFSSATAADLGFWRRVILPDLLGIASYAVGVTPLHCACLVKDGSGLLLSGKSGTGKSTLALSLSLNGFSYLSDDCTFLSQSGSELHAWGLPTTIKLLPDAVKYFPQLLHLEPSLSFNGELSFEVDPSETFGVKRCSSCVPRWVVFVERTPKADAVFERISSSDAASRFAFDLELLPSCISGQQAHRDATITALAQRECWVLRHGMSLSAVTKRLAEFCGA
jgi:hypothetical protein